MAVEHWKKDKICPVCGKDFKGTAKAQVCGSTCRSRLKRLIEAGDKPEYLLIAKSKGQKVPGLTGEKRLKFKAPEKKTQEALVITETKINYAEPTPESYDGKQIFPTMDEAAVSGAPLTLEQKIAHNEGIDRKIEAINKEPLPPGMLPKAHIMSKEIRTDELKDQKYSI